MSTTEIGMNDKNGKQDTSQGKKCLSFLASVIKCSNWVNYTTALCHVFTAHLSKMRLESTV